MLSLLIYQPQTKVSCMSAYFLTKILFVDIMSIRGLLQNHFLSSVYTTTKVF